MADTFEQLWREVRAYSPTVPAKLCQNWIRDAYRDLTRCGHLWSWALAESQWTFPAQYNSGSVTLTNESTTVTGAGTVWTSAHQGLQFQSGNHMFTISSVDSSTSITLDRKWGVATTASQSYAIKRAYVVAPSDYKGIHSVIDPVNEWRIHTHFSAKDLDTIDPARGDSGDPRIVADLRVNSTSGYPMFEVWPHITTVRYLKFLYWKIPADISSTISLPWNIQGDVLKHRALSNLCRWPGTIEQPNPMFNRLLAKDFDQEFQQRMWDHVRDDEETYVTQLWYDEYDNVPYVPLDAAYLQRHSL